MLTHFRISHFRSIDTFSCSFSQKSHIVGPNGSGKSHILEAIHLFAGGSPVYGKISSVENFSIEAQYMIPGTGSQIYQMHRQNQKEQYFIQHAKITKKSYLQSLPFTTVLVSPFDMNLLYFAPEIRRNYCDDILMRTFAQFRTVKRDYELTMRHRNALLKKIREQEAGESELNFWDSKFAELAELYGMYREKYSTFITENMTALPIFFGKYQSQFQYIGDWFHASDRQTYIKAYLQQYRQRDILTGHTHIGPHRDDFMLYIRHKEQNELAHTYLSRGEMKMHLLGLKILEANFLTKQKNVPVIVLVDDIFAELDGDNSTQFMENITQHQIILTSQEELKKTEKSNIFSCINLINS